MSEQNTEKRLYTVQDAAGYLVSIGAAGIGVAFIRGLISSGQLPFVKMGKRFYVTRAALDTWLDKHERRNH